MSADIARRERELNKKTVYKSNQKYIDRRMFKEGQVYFFHGERKKEEKRALEALLHREMWHSGNIFKIEFYP